MKKVLALVCLLALVFSAAVQAQVVLRMTEAEIRDAIKTNSEPLVSKDLQGWLDAKMVTIAQNRTGGPFASAEREAKGEKVYLWYDPNPTPFSFDPGEQKILLQMDLYREAVLIQKHFSGKYKMVALADGPDKLGATPKERARHIWDTEFEASQGEWRIVKKAGKTNLMPTIKEATQKGDTPENFLQGFYNIRIRSAVNSKAMAAAFAEIFEEEKAKLKAPAKR